MVIRYKDKRLRDICNDERKFGSKYADNLYNLFVKCKMILESVKNISEVYKYAGLHIEKLKSSHNIGKFKLNKSWRVEFEYNNKREFLSTIEITIVQIHNHKYKNKK